MCKYNVSWSKRNSFDGFFVSLQVELLKICKSILLSIHKNRIF